MAKRTLIIIVDSENNSTSFIPQNKFTTSEFKAVADQLRKNAAKLSMYLIKQENENKIVCPECTILLPNDVKYCGKCGLYLKR